MKTTPRILGLIPAAGQSARMGAAKLALPLGDRSILEHVIAVLHEAGISEILVVLGPRTAKLATSARTAGAQVLVLAEQTADMRATVERGLDWLEQHLHPAPADALLLLPADHPTLDAGVIRR